MFTSSGRPRKNRKPSYILIGDGFDEYEVISFLHRFRHAGLRIRSVSLFDKLVYSYQGVGIKADCALADNPFNPAEECLLILPAGGHNGDALRNDARVKNLLETFKGGRGKVVITDSTSSLAGDLNTLMTSPAYRPDQGQEFGDFVTSLAERLSVAGW
jgi:putative intracellular protease/amidase